MIVDEDFVLVDIENSLSDLFLSWLVWIELELLCHLSDTVSLCLLIVLVFNGEGVLVEGTFSVEVDTPVDELVWVALETLQSFLTNDFATIDKVVTSVMVVIDLAHAVIDLYELLPVVRLGRLVMLNGLELIWESSSHYKLVPAVSELRADLFDDELLVIFIERYTFHETVDLLAV